jgi:hypothetical protein
MVVVVVSGHDRGDESPQVLRAGSAASFGCAGGGESSSWPSASSSSSSSESSFRELDDVFLQVMH